MAALVMVLAYTLRSDEAFERAQHRLQCEWVLPDERKSLA